MTLRFNSYKLYLRIWFYLLPAVAFALAAYARFYDLSLHPIRTDYDSGFYLVVWLTTTLIWIIAAEHNRLFDINELFKENTGLKKTTAAVGSTYLVVIGVLFFYRQESMSRLFFAISVVLLLVLAIASRAFFRVWLKGLRPRKAVRVLVVGADEYAFGVASCLAEVPFVAIEVVAHLSLQGESDSSCQNRILPFHEPRNWGRIDFDEIVIALPPSDLGLLAEVAKRLEPLRVPIRTLLDFGGTPIVRDRLFQLGDLQFLDLASTPLESPAYFALKRAFDVVFSFSVMVLGLPLFLAIALAVKVSSAGPVFFRQERVGLNGRLFTMYKFRTMHTSPRSVSDRLHTSEADSQKTKLGRWLRKSSLDELPQFWNVLKGDMSVVGPRPERPYYVDKYMTEILHYGTRHRLKVGITGWAQVNGWRGNTSIECRIDADLYYLQNWTVWLDLRIIAMTIFKGMFAENA